MTNVILIKQCLRKIQALQHNISVVHRSRFEDVGIFILSNLTATAYRLKELLDCGNVTIITSNMRFPSPQVSIIAPNPCVFFLSPAALHRFWACWTSLLALNECFLITWAGRIDIFLPLAASTDPFEYLESIEIIPTFSVESENWRPNVCASVR